MKIIIAILVFSLIIIVHELGHFALAKKNGVYVTEFSIGMGPRIVSVQKGETRYSIKLLPFGGSCMMLGEDEDVADDDRAFGKKNVWARISIIAAGPIFNFILAFIISLVVVSLVGYDPATVYNVEDGSPAYEAGLREGDLITEIEGRNIDISRDISLYLYLNPLSGDPVDISYKRDGEKYSTKLVPRTQDNLLLGFQYNGEDAVQAAKVISLYKDYPIEEAGIEAGDIITAVDGTQIANGAELSNYMDEHPLEANKSVTITYEHDGESKEATVTPKIHSGLYTGVTFNAAYEKTNVWGVIKYSAIEVKFVIKQTFESLGMLVRGKLTKDDVAGPVGLVNTIGKAYESSKQYGLRSVLVNIGTWIILISANLGVMNLLPIPALDGGRLVFLFLEVIRRGKQIPREKEGMVHMIGLVALMALMVFVMFNDITNLFK